MANYEQSDGLREGLFLSFFHAFRTGERDKAVQQKTRRADAQAENCAAHSLYQIGYKPFQLRKNCCHHCKDRRSLSEEGCMRRQAHGEPLKCSDEGRKTQ